MKTSKRQFLALATSVAASLFPLGPGFAKRSDIGTPRILLGPMLGAPEVDAIRVWCRLSGPFEAALVLGEKPDLADGSVVARQVAGPEKDYSVHLIA